MFMFMLIGMLVLTGCMTAEEIAQRQQEQQWRQAHPVEAAQIDLMKAQAEREDAQAAETYSNMFRPRDSQPTQIKGGCRGVWLGGRYCQICTDPMGRSQTICN